MTLVKTDEIKRSSYLFTHPDGRVVELMEFRRAPNMDFLIENKRGPKGRPRSADRRRQRNALLNRDGNLCHYCRCEMGEQVGDAQPCGRVVTIEHVVPRAVGGPNTLDNLVLACYICNNELDSQLDKCHCDFCNAAFAKYHGGRR